MFDNQIDDILYDLPYCEDEQDIMRKEYDKLVRIVYGNPALVEEAKDQGSLPGGCFSTDEDGNLIVIRRNVAGYWSYTDAHGRSADTLNAILGVSKAQATAMKVGSMFGWGVPGAEPARYDENEISKRE